MVYAILDCKVSQKQRAKDIATTAEGIAFEAEDAATTVVKEEATTTYDRSRTRTISLDLDNHHSTVWTLLHNVLKFYLYKIFHTHESLTCDKDARKSFAVLFLRLDD